MKIIIILLLIVNIGYSTDLYVFSDGNGTYYSNDKINWHLVQYKLFKYATDINNFQLNFNMSLKEEQIKLYNFSGQEIKSFNIQNQNLTLELYDKNIYFLNIRSNDLVLNIVILKY